MVGLLERDAHVTALAEQLRAVGDRGRLVLVSGDAGAGKSSLVDAFCSAHVAAGRVLVGRCDDLFAPRPFGPVADIAREIGGPLAAALTRADQAAVLDAFAAELSSRTAAAVVVLEDLQWADEATLDLVRFVARRLDVLPWRRPTVTTTGAASARRSGAVGPMSPRPLTPTGPISSR